MAFAVFGVLAPGDVPGHGSPRHAGATGQGLPHLSYNTWTLGSARSGGSRSLSRKSLRVLVPPVLDFVPRGPADGLVPVVVPIYVLMKVILTKNLNKGIGFVNGMAETVLGMDRGNIIVKTDQGRRLHLCNSACVPEALYTQLS